MSRATYLYLSTVSCCDVGDGPAGFLPDGFLCAAEQVKEARESRAVQYHLKQSTVREKREMRKIQKQKESVKRIRCSFIINFLFRRTPALACV